MSEVSTNVVRPAVVAGGPRKRTVILAEKVQVKQFDPAKFAGQEPRHPSQFAKGPLQTNMLRDMADNRRRLEVAAQKRAAEQAKRAKVLASRAIKPAVKEKGKKRPVL